MLDKLHRYVGRIGVFSEGDLCCAARVASVKVVNEALPMKTSKPLTARVEKVRQLVDALGPPIAYRKLRGILNALEMQIEDGDYQRHAVARLCEALLATVELYTIPERLARQLEEAACSVVSLVEDGR